MERYESPTIEPVGGGEADPKSVVPIVDMQVALFAQVAAIVQVAALAFVVWNKISVYSNNG